MTNNIINNIYKDPGIRGVLTIPVLFALVNIASKNGLCFCANSTWRQNMEVGDSWPLDGTRILGPESEHHPLLLGGKGKETQALVQPEPQHRSKEAAELELENPLRTSRQTPLFYS